MKSKFLILSSVILIGITAMVISCTQEFDGDTDLNKSARVNKNILEEKTLLGNDIYLPKGTSWYYSNEAENEVIFELPENYAFLMIDTETGEFNISSQGGGYSCTCSKGGSCTVFSNEQLGYGCLQGTCEGSCTGRPVIGMGNKRIEGVLYIKNDMIDANLDTEKASLSEVGKKGFFQLKEVQEEVKRTYDIVYKYVEKPDFSTESYDRDKYVYAKTILYGFEIGLIIPNDENIKEFIPNLNTSVISSDGSPTSCSCSGESQGGTCKLEKRGMLGYVVYYCSGCTTCTMS